jgi:hypothetical protein
MLPYPKRAFKTRGPYKKPRNPSGKSTREYVKLKLSPKKRFYGKA